MSDDLKDLYQEVILDHYKAPSNYRVLEGCSHKAEGHNPLCGDHITVYLELNGDVIKDISFQGSGCAISKASASMMTASLKGKTKAEAEAFFEKFHAMVTSGHKGGQEFKDLGKLAVFSGVSEFPVRVKCASLAWHTMKAALETPGKSVSTE